VARGWSKPETWSKLLLAISAPPTTNQQLPTTLITKITGQLVELGEETLTLEVGAFEYEILIPEFSRRQLQACLHQEVKLYTIEYLEGNPMQGRMSPRLVGFLTEVEREFFELFCSVDGVGVKKALRAMVRPVREVALAIEEQNSSALSKLPGVGPATAERIVAKLRRKMPKFALMAAREEPAAAADVQPDVVSETFEVLRKLGHSESESRRLVDAALAQKKKFKDVQELINAIYQQSQK
jgi:Holliday junction DNA helicase RuvA